ncbi:Sec31 protein [Martiniozyma asiatica (nom. inval.)]|nr:Sec31 protein [Martiniozyma asiatica]
MVKLFEFKETATVAWSHDSIPLIAAGTLAGVIDDSFSSDSSLSLYSPFSKTQTQTPIYTAAAPAKFNSIAWSKPSDAHKKGLLAAGLENTEIHLWDAAKLVGSADLASATVATYQKHTSPVLQVKYNSFAASLASSASKGEIYIWDIAKGTAITAGTQMSPIGKVSSLAWNNAKAHVLASAGDNGYTSIWDLKAKKEVLQMNYKDLNMSDVQWHPTESVKLVTATESDNEPVILTWDLRNTSAPEKILRGHKKGILSLDWCKQDPTLLLSSGKDDASMLWNPIDGIQLATYPSLPNWVQQTQFAPELPDVFVSASLSKNVVIQSLQDTSDPISSKVQSNDESDFWNNIATTETQQPTFHVKQAPAWLKRPISANFGFGGKLVITAKNQIKIVTPLKDETLDQSAEEMISALKDNDFKSVCESKANAQSNLDGGKDWKLLSEFLTMGRLETLKALLPEKETAEDAGKSNDKNAFGDDGDGDGDDDDDDDDFFAQLGNAKVVQSKSTYNPEGSFDLFNTTDNFEKEAIELILENKTDDAVDFCIANDHVMEALVISMNGSDMTKHKARCAYFAKYASSSPLSRLLYSSCRGSISDVVNNAEIDESSWKKVVKSIISFSKDTPRFSEELTLLGDKILKSGMTNARDNAFRCYVSANALDKVAAIWLSELENYETYYLENENSNGSKNTAFEARFKALGEIVEKVIVFESTASATSSSSESLAPLGKVFLEYADDLANFGHFELAFKILQRVPETIPGIKEQKERISKSLAGSTTTVQTDKVSKKSYGFNNKYGAPTPLQPSTSMTSVVPNGATALPPNPYAAPAVSNFKPGPYTPANATATATANVPSAISGYSPVPVHAVPSYGAPKSSYKVVNPYAIAPTNSLEAAVPSPPSFSNVPQTPASQRKDMGGWNDLPSNLSNKPKPSGSVPNIYDVSNIASQSPSINPVSIMPSAVPPPPVGHSRSSSKNISAPPAKPLTRLPSKNPYEPKPEIHEPVRVASLPPQQQFINSTPPTPVLKQKANPYAPSPTNALANPAAGVSKMPPPAPSSSQFSSINQMPTPGNFSAVPPLPPKANPYAPASKVNPYAPKTVNSNSYAPPGSANGSFSGPGGVAAPPAVNASFPPPPPAANASFPQPPPAANASFPQPPPAANASFPQPPPPAANASFPQPPPPAANASFPQPPPPAANASFPPPPSNVSPVVNEPAVQELSPLAIEVESSLFAMMDLVAPHIPEKFEKQLSDARKRLEILRSDLASNKIDDSLLNKLKQISDLLQSDKSDQALEFVKEITESGNGAKWIPGIKRLVLMSKYYEQSK